MEKTLLQEIAHHKGKRDVVSLMEMREEIGSLISDKVDQINALIDKGVTPVSERRLLAQAQSNWALIQAAIDEIGRTAGSKVSHILRP